jgi:hypothetical protein
LLGKGQIVLETQPDSDSGGMLDNELLEYFSPDDRIPFNPDAKLDRRSINAAKDLPLSGRETYSPCHTTGYFFPAISKTNRLRMLRGKIGSTLLRALSGKSPTDHDWSNVRDARFISPHDFMIHACRPYYLRQSIDPPRRAHALIFWRKTRNRLSLEPSVCGASWRRGREWRRNESAGRKPFRKSPRQRDGDWKRGPGAKAGKNVPPSQNRSLRKRSAFLMR